MNRDVARVLALALLAVVAVGLVSATVTDVTQPGVGSSEGGGGGAGSVSENGESDQPGLLPSEDERGEPVGDPSGGPANWGQIACVQELQTPQVQAGIVAALALLFGVVRYRQNTLAAVTVLGVVGPTVGLVYLALLCPSQDIPSSAASERGNPSEASEGGAMEGGSVPETVFDAPLWLVVLVAAVAVGVLLVAASRSDGFGSVFGAAEPEEADAVSSNVAAVGRVAGRAADRIQTGVDADNEVYRAWAEMTEHLDVERPASSTPAEFADAAVAAGIDRADVEELRRLFEAVRYGGETATDERERRAVDALRRIEASYADTDGATTDDPRAGADPRWGDGGDGR